MLAPRQASAHAVGISSGEYIANGSRVEMKLAFARGEVMRLVPQMDSNHDSLLVPSEVEAARALVASEVLAHVNILGDMTPCKTELKTAALTEEDGLIITAVATCVPVPREVTLRFDLADSLASGHRHVARVIGATRSDHALHKSSREVSFAPGAETSTTNEAASAASTLEAPKGAEPTPSSLGSFISMGVHHILEGWDHILFLIGLVIVFTTRRSLLAMVTAFTLGHSISLALATFDVITPSSRLVEPLIALSIAYVGAENFLKKTPGRRWQIAFPFGLIHGFGFAGAMKEIGITRADAALPLVGFNVGVEIGQLAILIAAVPLIQWLRKQNWFTTKGVPTSNIAIAAVGLVLCIFRVAFPD